MVDKTDTFEVQIDCKVTKDGKPFFDCPITYHGFDYAQLVMLQRGLVDLLVGFGEDAVRQLYETLPPQPPKK